MLCTRNQNFRTKVTQKNSKQNSSMKIKGIFQKLKTKILHFIRRFPVIPYLLKWFLLSLLLAFFVGTASTLFLVSLDWDNKLSRTSFVVIVFIAFWWFAYWLFLSLLWKIDSWRKQFTL